jgi:hypothetical protein
MKNKSPMTIRVIHRKQINKNSFDFMSGNPKMYKDIVRCKKVSKQIKEYAIQSALSELNGWIQRHKHIKEFFGLVSILKPHIENRLEKSVK